ncbi:hypothetical protein BDV95DRAFT_591199 [Massariosphaeria phaeospora]|uniref:F-box domain-containing protein n=1 Tax=Massariosphaeria phaeospora TaxID=100035 RepID=A0A7C8MFN4_9PLEO|nr:hypothetical protein BDV95DRAFT_591199 [Massariosphaeria phaeospora]
MPPHPIFPTTTALNPRSPQRRANQATYDPPIPTARSDPQSTYSTGEAATENLTNGARFAFETEPFEAEPCETYANRDIPELEDNRDNVDIEEEGATHGIGLESALLPVHPYAEAMEGYEASTLSRLRSRRRQQREDDAPNLSIYLAFPLHSTKRLSLLRHDPCTDPRGMASLTSLPNELLYAITAYLQGDAMTLRNLSKVARRLCPVAQTAMYMSVFLRSKPRAVEPLVRELLRVPRYASELQHLEIDPEGKHQTHRVVLSDWANSRGYNPKGLADRQPLVRRSAPNSVGNPGGLLSPSTELLLYLLPKLETLIIGNTKDCRKDPGLLFQRILQLQRAITPNPPGLANVKKISTWSRNIRILELLFTALQAPEVDFLGCVEQLFPGLPFRGLVLSRYQNLESLTVRSYARELAPRLRPRGCTWDLIKLLSCKHLKHLEICIERGRWDNDHVLTWNLLAKILELLAPSLESLKLDQHVIATFDAADELIFCGLRSVGIVVLFREDGESSNAPLFR